MLDERLIARLFAAAHAERWGVDREAFACALDASVAKAFAGRTPERKAVETYLESLHLEDLALACACAAGIDEAWQHFVLTFRPVLYRAADAIDSTGNGRELADSLYADLFGLGGRSGERQSLFRYFHGRSSLATWLRAVLAQRHVDRVRERRHTDPLPDDDSAGAFPASTTLPDPERHRFLLLMRRALLFALGLLAPNDRLRLACYYAQQMTLAQIGRLLGEHEATVSRHLSRTRAAVRTSVEEHLRNEHHLDEDGITECFRSVAADAGPLDLDHLLGAGHVDPPGSLGPRPFDFPGSLAASKKGEQDRSKRGKLA